MYYKSIDSLDAILSSRYRFRRSKIQFCDAARSRKFSVPYGDNSLRFPNLIFQIFIITLRSNPSLVFLAVDYEKREYSLLGPSDGNIYSDQSHVIVLCTLLLYILYIYIYIKCYSY